MKSIVSDPALVARCGLYCGACKAYLKEKCLGCAENEKATWCKVKKCTAENNYATCAECEKEGGAAACKEFNSFMAKVFGFIFRSDRAACIARIKEIGIEQYAAEMAEKKEQTIKR